ncbi:hypothetical protein ACF3MZ_28835 [Paenibacillaceae bacterium WGS1546]|uniref:DUF7667 family protein n=1 Tax=Cohnella sp. WGS1546 TaxID=3366810 RepID=UPI00372D633B
MGMLPVYERMAELRVVQRRRPLLEAERRELEQCLDLNADYCYRLGLLYNLSLVASMSEDDEWQHEICSEIERLGGRLPGTNV